MYNTRELEVKNLLNKYPVNLSKRQKWVYDCGIIYLFLFIMNLILLRKIRKSLNSRRDIYGDNIYLTRREYSKFGTTERILRAYIDLLRSKGLKRVGSDYHGEVRHTNRYEFTQELQEFFNQMFPIMDFKAIIPSIETICNRLRLIYRATTKNYIVSENKERKITFNTDLKVFTVWNKNGGEHKWYNYFTGIKIVNEPCN